MDKWPPMEDRNFCGFDCPPQQARIVLFGAPYDGSASFRPGARFAPAAMREDSWGLETYSPRLDRDLEEICPADAGDLELASGDQTRALEAVEAMSHLLYERGQLPVMIGGDHSLTLGAVRAAFKQYPDLHLLHLDAHTDLREDYLGDPFSHASVIRRCHDLLGDGRIHSFGIRSGLREEFQFARTHLDFHAFTLEGIRELASSLGDIPFYLTLDLDVLDPSVLPGTGTPEPGGASYEELLEALEDASDLRIIGCDFMELAPRLDPSGASTAAACKLLREWLLLIG